MHSATIARETGVRPRLIRSLEELSQVCVGLDRPHPETAHLVLEIDAVDLPAADDDQLDAPEIRYVLLHSGRGPLP